MRPIVLYNAAKRYITYNDKRRYRNKELIPIYRKAN